MGKHLPPAIRLQRETKRLEALATERGYESVAVMLYDMYIVQKIPYITLGKTLYTPLWSLRKRLLAAGIKLRSRGGRNNVRLEVTPELLQEVERDGIPAVAQRAGLDDTALAARLRKWKRENVV